MDVRHRIGLESSSIEPIPRLLFVALYSARDEQEFVILVEEMISELKAALNALSK